MEITGKYIVLLSVVFVVQPWIGHCQNVGVMPGPREERRHYVWTDKTGRRVDLDSANAYSANRYKVQEGKYWGIEDGAGRLVAPCRYLCVEPMREGLIAAYDSSYQWGYIDTNGAIVVPLIYKYGESFSEGVAPVCLNDKWLYIDRDGRKKFDCPYDICNTYSEGRALVQLHGKIGFINRRGRLVVPLRYERATRFRNGRSEVLKNGEYYAINRHGRIKKHIGHYYWTPPI